jgi:hypothetical protein
VENEQEWWLDGQLLPDHWTAIKNNRSTGIDPWTAGINSWTVLARWTGLDPWT